MQGTGPGSSSERTRTAITAALRKKLKDLMGDFQDLRQRLNEEYRSVQLLAWLTGTGKAILRRTSNCQFPFSSSSLVLGVHLIIMEDC